MCVDRRECIRYEKSTFIRGLSLYRNEKGMKGRGRI